VVASLEVRLVVVGGEDFGGVTVSLVMVGKQPSVTAL